MMTIMNYLRECFDEYNEACKQGYINDFMYLKPY